MPITHKARVVSNLEYFCQTRNLFMLTSHSMAEMSGKDLKVYEVDCYPNKPTIPLIAHYTDIF